MTLNNVVILRNPVSPLARHRMRARPAEVISIRRHQQRHHGFSSNAMFVLAGIVVWLAAVLVGLTAVRRSSEWVNDLRPTWPWWPLW